MKDRVKVSQRSYTFTLKELSEIFHNFEMATNKMFENDLNLERNMTIHQGIEKMLGKGNKNY